MAGPGLPGRPPQAVLVQRPSAGKGWGLGSWAGCGHLSGEGGKCGSAQEALSPCRCGLESLNITTDSTAASDGCRQFRRARRCGNAV